MQQANPFDAQARPNGVVGDRDRAMLRRIRLKAVASTAGFAVSLAGALATYMGPVYPWFACAAWIMLIAAGAYLVGWARGSRQLRLADEGDELAVRYTLEGPVFGSIEWWWTAPPRRRNPGRLKLRLMGALMLALAAAYAVGWWFARGLGPLYAAVTLLSAVPPLAVGATCFAFLSHPSARAADWFSRVRWACLFYMAFALIVLGWIAVGAGEDATAPLVAFAGMGALISASTSALGKVALESLRRPGQFTPQRERIRADLDRMADQEPQHALDGVGMSQVNRRRERRLLLRAVGWVAVIVVVAVVRVLL
ncbi:hypothetical protein DSM100685_0779 [Bifidobacterium avesanii]|nr:hypothetical protein DSM100685_0779 [Bifidobacterium avesanii]